MVSLGRLALQGSFGFECVYKVQTTIIFCSMKTKAQLPYDRPLSVIMSTQLDKSIGDAYDLEQRICYSMLISCKLHGAKTLVARGAKSSPRELYMPCS